MCFDKSCYSKEKSSDIFLKEVMIIGTVRDDLTGRTFGEWIVLKRDSSRIDKGVYWLCQCTCINKTIKSIRRDHLIKGDSISCGCLKEMNKRRKLNTYDLSGEYGIGYTNTTNEEFYFDLEDYEKIKDFVWNKDKNGYIHSGVYKNEIYTTVKFHRLVMNVEEKECHVDHIYHQKHDNRKTQLRLVNSQQNAINRSLCNINTSGVTGVYYHNKDKNWVASLTHNKDRLAKEFKTFDEAVAQRKAWEEIYFQEFAYQEPPEEYLAEFNK
jgi:hypothetical protein